MHSKRSFKLMEKRCREGRETAISEYYADAQRASVDWPFETSSDGLIFVYPYYESELSCGFNDSHKLERTMKTKYKNLPLLGLGLAISLSCTSSAVAADVAGFTSGTLKILSTTPLKNGHTAARVLYLVGVVTDAQEGPFHGATQQCLATVINSADGSLVEGHGAKREKGSEYIFSENVL